VYTWRYVDEGQGLELEGTGIVLGTELLQANQEMLAEQERLRRVRYALVVFDAAAKMELSAEEIRQIVAQDRLMSRWMPKLSLAIVAHEDLQFGLSRMWEGYVLGVGWRTAVFRVRAEAEIWLHQPSELER